MLNLQSADDLPNVLHELGKNKKKADDTWILQAAIDQCATTPTCVANEFMKPQLSTHIIDKFHSYAWAATGNEIMDGITLFNIVFMIKPAAQTMATKLEHLKAVESGGTAMSYTNAKIFLKNVLHFLVTPPPAPTAWLLIVCSWTSCSESTTPLL